MMISSAAMWNASSLATSAPTATPSPRPSWPISARKTVFTVQNYAPVASNGRSLLTRSQRGRRSMMTRATVVAASAPTIVPPPGGAPVPPVLPESEIPGLSQFLDTLNFDANGMLVAIVQVKREK